jgi:hypothetical protein
MSKMEVVSKCLDQDIENIEIWVIFIIEIQ